MNILINVLAIVSLVIAAKQSQNEKPSTVFAVEGFIITNRA